MGEPASRSEGIRAGDRNFPHGRSPLPGAACVSPAGPARLEAQRKPTIARVRQPTARPAPTRARMTGDNAGDRSERRSARLKNPQRNCCEADRGRCRARRSNALDRVIGDHRESVRGWARRARDIEADCRYSAMGRECGVWRAAPTAGASFFSTRNAIQPNAMQPFEIKHITLGVIHIPGRLPEASMKTEYC